MKKYDLIVVGGGPAGMLAAYRAKKGLDKVGLIEQNEKLGKKLYITGKGRSNITNDRDISEFIDKLTVNPYFMYSAFYNFSNRDLIDFLNKAGLQTKVERGQRVFPASDKSSDLIKTLEKSLAKVDILLEEEVINIQYKDNIFITKSNKATYESKKLILATGGMTYPATGSRGAGYALSRKLGHNIIRPRGALLPLNLRLKNLDKVSGISIKNAKISTYKDSKKVSDIFGDFLFTHKGISGPIVLSLSDKLVDQDPNKIELYCDFKPAVDEQSLDRRLLKDLDRSPKAMVETILTSYFPKSLVEFLLDNSNIAGRIKAYEVDRSTRLALLKMMKSFNLAYIKTAKDELGIITKGGVDTKEIDPSTMESKLIPGLYFAGELVDVSALTGGYNLQIAFSTGFLAGKAACQGTDDKII